MRAIKTLAVTWGGFHRPNGSRFRESRLRSPIGKISDPVQTPLAGTSSRFLGMKTDHSRIMNTELSPTEI
jgi:hypothetical protein